MRKPKQQQAEKKPNFAEISEDTINFFKEEVRQKSFPSAIRFKYVHSEKQKQMIQIKKVNDAYVFLFDFDLLISLNEEMFDKFDDTTKKILINQELDKIMIDMNSGKIKTRKPNLVTFSGILNKYGVDAVAKANQVEVLTSEQKEDMESEFIK